MAPPPPLPTRKVSNLVAMFESSSSASSDALPPIRPRPPPPPTRSQTSLPPPPSANAHPPKRTGSVSEVVRKFSLGGPSSSTPPATVSTEKVERPKASEMNQEETERKKEGEDRRKLSQMDWTERPRDATQLLAQTLASPISPTTFQPLTSSTSTPTTSTPPRTIEPTRKSTINPLRHFKPQRTAPPPPPPSSSASKTSPAPTITVPANLEVRKENDEVKGRLSMGGSKEERKKKGLVGRVEDEVKNEGKDAVMKVEEVKKVVEDEVKKEVEEVKKKKEEEQKKEEVAKPVSPPVVEAPRSRATPPAPTPTSVTRVPPPKSTPAIELIDGAGEKPKAPLTPISPHQSKPNVVPSSSPHLLTPPSTKNNSEPSVTTHSSPPINQVVHHNSTPIPLSEQTPHSSPLPASRPSLTSNPTSISFSTPPSTPRHRSSPLFRTPPPFHQRPSLTRSPSSARTSHNLPASTIFNSGAEPLVLPALDLYLDELPSVVWSDPDKVLSKEEKLRWKDWVGIKKVGLWKRIGDSLSGNKERGSYKDLELQEGVGVEVGVGVGKMGIDEQKKFIFPPMDMMPKDVTVTDLKRNQLKPTPTLKGSSVLSSLINGVIAAEGSTYGITYETAESFRDLMQMISLLLVGASKELDLEKASWYRTVFVTVPSVLSLDFVSAFGKAILWLWIFTLLTFLAVWELFRFTGGIKKHTSEEDQGEGLDREGSSYKSSTPSSRLSRFRNRRGYKTFVTFFVTSMYLPLSKISIGALAWTSDYWAIPNPYLTTDNPILSPLGPTKDYYAPLDFCYKTTMLRPSGVKNFNWAWIILVVAALTVGWLSVALPIRLHRIIQLSVPRVDKYTELGELRQDVTGEYERLLDKDKSPFNFLYKDYRSRWAYFKAIYMGVKLVGVLLVVLLTKNNCIFRTQSSTKVDVIRQSALLVFMSAFLLTSIISRPYLDSISNNSDRISRVSYVVLAFLGLLVALNVPGEAELGGWVYLTVNAFAYLFNGYFSLIGTHFMQRLIKRAYYRLDFSIDLFSPHIDLAKHIARRIWQESLSVILLAGPDFKMPKTEALVFTDDPALPPQLLNFQGTQAERHVENLKILREIGLEAYSEGLEARYLSKHSRVLQTRLCVQSTYTGPDIYWRNPLRSHPFPLLSYFGRLDVVPFPFVAVFRYDEDPSRPIYLTEVDDLQLLIRQNESNEVLEAHRVRMCLRALDGQTVYAPYSETKLVGSSKHTTLEARIHYRLGVLNIRRNSNVLWRGYNYASGFTVTITYSDGQGQNSEGSLVYGEHKEVDGDLLGIPPDFQLSPSVAKLFRRNRAIIDARIPLIDSALALHRDYFFGVAQAKHRALSHAFLFDVIAADDLSKKELEEVLREEEDPRVKELTETYSGAIQYSVERMRAVTSGHVNSWWFCLWDDIWRRNSTDIPALSNQPSAFSPHYRSSICYRPMSRPKLEAFLVDHDLWTYHGKKGFFNSGLLNRIYFYLDQILFEKTPLAVPIHLGSSEKFVPWDQLEKSTRYPPQYRDPDQSRITTSSYDTGNGTDHDDSQILFRHAFPWEEIFFPPPIPWRAGQRWACIKDRGLTFRRSAEIWLGLHPYEYRPLAENGVTFDLRSTPDGWELPRRRERKDTY